MLGARIGQLFFRGPRSLADKGHGLLPNRLERPPAALRFAREQLAAHGRLQCERDRLDAQIGLQDQRLRLQGLQWLAGPALAFTGLQSLTGSWLVSLLGAAPLWLRSNQLSGEVASYAQLQGQRQAVVDRQAVCRELAALGYDIYQHAPSLVRQGAAGASVCLVSRSPAMRADDDRAQQSYLTAVLAARAARLSAELRARPPRAAVALAEPVALGCITALLAAGFALGTGSVVGALVGLVLGGVAAAAMHVQLRLAPLAEARSEARQAEGYARVRQGAYALAAHRLSLSAGEK